MKDKQSNNFVVRGVFGLLFAVAVIGAILTGPIAFRIMLYLIIVGGTFELYRMTKKLGFKPQVILGLLSCISIFTVGCGSLFGMTTVDMSKMIFILTIPSMFIFELFSESKTPIANLGSTVLPLLYLAFPATLLCDVALMIGGGEWNKYLVIAYIFIVWANDTFAYLVGVTLGSRPMFPRISPKKSWEGFFGGVCGSFILSLVAAKLFGQSYFVWGGMAVIASVTGVLGDLVESMFKRSAGVKDSGDLIPGHGGWLDRFDAILISTPFVYVYLFILNTFELI